jgi:hypothetical protein
MHRRLRSPKPPRLQPAGQSVCGEASADRRTPGRYPRRMRARKAGPEAERWWTPVGCVISRARHLGENTTRRRYRRGHEPVRLPGGGCDRGPLDARACARGDARLAGPLRSAPLLLRLVRDACASSRPRSAGQPQPGRFPIVERGDGRVPELDRCMVVERDSKLQRQYLKPRGIRCRQREHAPPPGGRRRLKPTDSRVLHHHHPGVR